MLCCTYLKKKEEKDRNKLIIFRKVWHTFNENSFFAFKVVISLWLNCRQFDKAIHNIQQRKYVSINHWAQLHIHLSLFIHPYVCYKYFQWRKNLYYFEIYSCIFWISSSFVERICFGILKTIFASKKKKTNKKDDRNAYVFTQANKGERSHLLLNLRLICSRWKLSKFSHNFDLIRILHIFGMGIPAFQTMAKAKIHIVESMSHNAIYKIASSLLLSLS